MTYLGRCLLVLLGAIVLSLALDLHNVFPSNHIEGVVAIVGLAFWVLALIPEDRGDAK